MRVYTRACKVEAYSKGLKPFGNKVRVWVVEACVVEAVSFPIHQEEEHQGVVSFGDRAHNNQTCQIDHRGGLLLGLLPHSALKEVVVGTSCHGAFLERVGILLQVLTQISMKSASHSSRVQSTTWCFFC